MRVRLTGGLMPLEGARALGMLRQLLGAALLPARGRHSSLACTAATCNALHPAKYGISA